MDDIGKVTPGARTVAPVPREHPPAREKEPHQGGAEQDPAEQNNNEHEEDENNHHDRDSGIDLYV